MQLGQWGAKEHGAYEVSPFYKAGQYSLTAGMGRLGVRAGGRFVPIAGPPAPDYWNTNLEGLGRHDGGNSARRFTNLKNQILRKRSKGQAVPRRLREQYQRHRAITPGAERKKIPVTLKPHPLISAKGSAGFLQWFRSKHPVLFARMERERPELIVKTPVPAMEGLGQDPGMPTDPITTQTKPSSSWVQQIFGFADKYISNEHQKEMAEINLNLAAQGEAPVEAIENLQARMDAMAAGYAAQPPAVKFGIPLAIAAAGVGLFFFMQR